MHGLERGDAALLRSLDRDLEAVKRKAGEWLACRPGCFECCVGPFPVTRLDVWRLRRGLRELRRDDPARARRIRERARRAVEILADDYPGDAASGRLVDDTDALDRFFERHASLACPVLDPETGECELYDSRPVSCRTYGPPARFGAEDAPPCRLCFQGAPREVIERCRIEPDRPGWEDALLAEMGAEPGRDWETLIAFALVGSGGRDDER